MTTITREQALKIIEAADEVISALAGTNEDVHPGSDNMLRLWDDLNDRYAPPEVVRELARIVLDAQEIEMLERNCATRRPGRAPYEFGEYIALLIRQDDARVRGRIKSISRKCCGKCGERVPVNSCPCNGDSQCWVTKGWHETKLIV